MNTYYSQRDPKWSGVQLGVCKNETIGKSGCVITSLSNFLVSTSSSKERENPKEMNEWCKKKGIYASGCLVDMSRFAKLRNMSYLKTTKKPKVEKCLAETDFYKKNGVPQHFFMLRLKDGKIIDPLDSKPEWKKNPYGIVSYRVFESLKSPKSLNPTETIKSTETVETSQKSEETTSLPTQNEIVSVKIASEPLEVESGINVPITIETPPIKEIGHEETIMESLAGYRTIISAVLQFLVTLGIITQTEVGVVLEGIMGVISLGLLGSTIYFRMKANLSKKD